MRERVIFSDKHREDDTQEELREGTTQEAETGDAEDTGEVCGLSAVSLA